MKTKQMALEALKNSTPVLGDYQDENAKAQQKHIAAIAALEADIAQPVEPVAWISPESMRRLRAGGNDSKGTVPVHASRSYVSKVALYTTPPEPAVNAELLEAAKWCVALCEETGMTETNAYASAKSAIAKATS